MKILIGLTIVLIFQPHIIPSTVTFKVIPEPIIPTLVLKIDKNSLEAQPHMSVWV